MLHAKLLQSRPTLCDPVAHQAPLSMGFSRQEYWRGLPFPPPGDRPDPGTEPTSLMSSALAGGFFTTRATWETPVDIGGRVGQKAHRCSLQAAVSRNVEQESESFQPTSWRFSENKEQKFLQADKGLDDCILWNQPNYEWRGRKQAFWRTPCGLRGLWGYRSSGLLNMGLRKGIF